MVESTDSGQLAAASSPDSATTSPPVLTNGPQTVINPEQRDRAIAAREGGSDSESSLPTSDVWSQLFPSETEPRSSGIIEGPDGVQLGHFVIEERIGMGGMGAVFRATDQCLQRIVALKVLSPEQSLDASAVQRFHNEARAAARLDNDNVARVFYIGEDKGLHFIAFEFVTGTNVLDMIRKHGRMHPEDAVNYALQVASALKHTAAQGVVHRDIKPSNIIITPPGRAKLVDLGLARKENSESAADLTMAGTTLGTFDYISPEQAKDPRNVDVRSDIYSLGCTLYHMLTGQPPYPEGTVLQKLLDHQGKEAPDPAKINRHVSDELSSIVKKMMASDPRRRYATADLLIHDLMLMAGSLGLRGIHPDGLVWTSSNPAGNRFWEKHLGWMVTVAALLIIVGVLQAFPDIGHDLSEFNENRVNSAEQQPRSSPSGDQNLASAAGAKVDQEDRQHQQTVPGASEDKIVGHDKKSSDTEPEANTASTRAESEKNGTNDDVSSTSTVLIPDNSLVPETKNIFADDPDIKPFTLPKDDGKSPVPTSEKTDLNSKSNETTPTNTETVTTTDGTNDKPSAVVVKDDPPQRAADLLPIVAYDVDNHVTKKYRSLEAACSEIEDGGTILLNFNGSRQETPIRITKKNVTLRAGKGFQPLIEFVPRDIPGEGFQERMITVTNGPVNLHDLNLKFTIPQQVDSSKHLALISIERPQSVRLQRLTITIENESNCGVSVARLESPPSGMLTDMMMKNANEYPGIIVEFNESFIRGAGNLLSIRQAEGVRIVVEESAIAMKGSLLRVEGNSESPPENARIELKLEHSSCLYGRNLISMDSDVFPGKLPPTHVDASDNIFSSLTNTSLVSVAGSLETEDFQQLLDWKGEKNYYDGFQNIWEFPTQDETLDFEAWKLFWSQSSEVAATNKAIVWSEPRPNVNDVANVSSSVFSLVSDLTLNPAVAGATDGDDAGVDLVKLPLIPQQIVPD